VAASAQILDMRMQNLDSVRAFAEAEVFFTFSTSTVAMLIFCQVSGEEDLP
jgi:hypothetical protein